MSDESSRDVNQTDSTADSLKGWVMAALTFIFVFLYVLALLGMIEPPKDISMIARLEPVIFVIIGYYFGRLPAQANEKTLKNQVERQSQKADAAQQIKEKTQQQREILEEKIRNAKITLAPQMHNLTTKKSEGADSFADKTGQAKQAVETAMKILDS